MGVEQPYCSELSERTLGHIKQVFTHPVPNTGMESEHPQILRKDKNQCRIVNLPALTHLKAKNWLRGHYLGDIIMLNACCLALKFSSFGNPPRDDDWRIQVTSHIKCGIKVKDTISIFDEVSKPRSMNSRQSVSMWVQQTSVLHRRGIEAHNTQCVANLQFQPDAPIQK